MGNGNVSLQTVYKKLGKLEERLSKVEERLVPEIKISKREMAELEKVRKEIRKGEFASEKELFSILSK
jgi:hypothetical protein